MFSPPSCLLHSPSTSPSPFYTAHESVLEKKCWLPLGFKCFYVLPDGRVFRLVSKGREKEEGGTVIQLRVPQGAVRALGEGVMEVRYAVIADRPFRTPEGYSLCSMAVYIHYNPARTTKPFRLTLPHWSGALDHPVFVTSPHTLPKGSGTTHFIYWREGILVRGMGSWRWMATAPCLDRPFD